MKPITKYGLSLLFASITIIAAEFLIGVASGFMGMELDPQDGLIFALVVNYFYTRANKEQP